ncbi:MAG: MFS transporter, partial [Candidatus Hadarchaeia archaeon]
MISGLLFMSGLVMVGSIFYFDSWSTARYFWNGGCLIAGIGAGFARGSVLPTVSRWFANENLGKAMGITSIGPPLGRMLLSPFAAFLIATLGFSNQVFLLLGVLGTSAVIGIGVIFWKSPSSDDFDEVHRPKSESSDEDSAVN